MPGFSKLSSSWTSPEPSRPAKLSGFIRLRIAALEGVSVAFAPASRDSDVASDFLPLGLSERVFLSGVVSSTAWEVEERMRLREDEGESR